MKCPYCGSDNEDDYMYCLLCGAKLEKEVIQEMKNPLEDIKPEVEEKVAEPNTPIKPNIIGVLLAAGALLSLLGPIKINNIQIHFSRIFFSLLDLNIV